MSRNYDRKSPEQIIRLDGKNVFFEVMNSAFDIGKVLINFQEYDKTQEKGNRIKQEISIYFDMDKFLVLANDLLSGRFNALANKAKEEQKKGSYKYCKEIYMDQGGTSADRLASKGKARPDGKSEARLMKITPGDKVEWMISAELGPGEESDTGLIMPKFAGNRAEKQVRVPLSSDDFKRMVLIVTKHMEAFLAAKYVRGEFTYKKDEKAS
jgi:hypothetical protein